MTKDGLKKPNYYGSLTHAATCRLGNFQGEEVHAPFSSLLPMVHPNDIVLGGWDISGACSAAPPRQRPARRRQRRSAATARAAPSSPAALLTTHPCPSPAFHLHFAALRPQA
jgi:hypothetical protein